MLFAYSALLASAFRKTQKSFKVDQTKLYISHLCILLECFTYFDLEGFP